MVTWPVSRPLLANSPEHCREASAGYTANGQALGTREIMAARVSQTDRNGRRLEGPGSEARLRNIQRRFRRFHGAAARTGQRPRWMLALMCAATFAATLSIGLWLTR